MINLQFLGSDTFSDISPELCFYLMVSVLFILKGCKVYALTGGIFGTISILSMVVIGYDRLDVICK